MTMTVKEICDWFDASVASASEFYRRKAVDRAFVAELAQREPQRVIDAVQGKLDANPYWLGRVCTAENIMQMFDVLEGGRKDDLANELDVGKERGYA